ncbi:MAG: hypothetical protein ACRECO_18465 [Xanthobacteraceae bacterium]
MTVIVGIALIALAVAGFWYSLPREDKTAFFVGTEWEPYAVVAMIMSLAAGSLLVISGAQALN